MASFKICVVLAVAVSVVSSQQTGGSQGLPSLPQNPLQGFNLPQLPSLPSYNFGGQGSDGQQSGFNFPQLSFGQGSEGSNPLSGIYNQLPNFGQGQGQGQDNAGYFGSQGFPNFGQVFNFQQPTGANSQQGAPQSDFVQDVPQGNYYDQYGQNY